MTFPDLMEQGHDMLGNGDFDAACVTFEHATTAAKSKSERCRALQMRGIALRLEGKELWRAVQVLRGALRLAGSDWILSACIERDLGMALLDQAVRSRDGARYDEAERSFISSRDALLRQAQVVEAAVSEGFLYRLYFLKGLKTDAVEGLRRVAIQLNGENPVFELNNLIWLARASLFDRWRYALRVFALIKQTGHTRRRREYLVLLGGGNFLYVKLSK